MAPPIGAITVAEPPRAAQLRAPDRPVGKAPPMRPRRGASAGARPDPGGPTDLISQRFSIVVVQPTTLCNLDCAYCYLPDRAMQRLMTPTVAARVADSIAAQGGTESVVVVWHCGEPLATPIGHFRELLAPFEPLRAAGALSHSVQTNGTLITPAWCDLFTEYGFAVGVSVDGPAHLNRLRRDRAGRDSLDRTLRGIGILKAAGIEFTAICVVSPETVDHADELVAFFTDLGCTNVGFNIEEQEGGAPDRPAVTAESAQRFWRRLFDLRAAGSTVAVRELDHLLEFLRNDSRAATQLRLDPIPTVGFDGSTVVCSPELLGARGAEYGDFIVGNVRHALLPELIVRAMNARYVREYATAIAECAASCEFYDFCRGAEAGNRYFEHGTFAVAETQYCRNTRQALIRAAADYLDTKER